MTTAARAKADMLMDAITGPEWRKMPSFASKRDAIAAALSAAREQGDYMEGWEEGASSMSRRALNAEHCVSIATEALEIIAGKRQCIDNLMGNREVAEYALRLMHEAST